MLFAHDTHLSYKVFILRMPKVEGMSAKTIRENVQTSAMADMSLTVLCSWEKCLIIYKIRRLLFHPPPPHQG